MDLTINMSVPESALVWLAIFAIVVGVLLVYGSWRMWQNGQTPVAILLIGTLLMLVNPFLGIAVMLIAAVIVSIGGDIPNGLLTVVLTVVAYVLAIILATVVTGAACLIAGV